MDEIIQLSKTSLVLIILGCLLGGLVFGLISGGFRGRKVGKTRIKKKNTVYTRRITIGFGSFWGGNDEEHKDIGDGIGSAMGSIFGIAFWGIILFKIIRWLI